MSKLSKNGYVGVILVLITLLLIWWRRPDRQDAALDASTATDVRSPLLSEPQDSRARRLQSIIDDGNVPIQFWGKVVDENGVGLGNASIRYRVIRVGILTVEGGIGPDDGTSKTTATRADGSFEVTRENGRLLGIEDCVKEGYVLLPNQKSAFAYSSSPEIYEANKDAPQIFVMKSAALKMKLRTASGKTVLKWDGVPVRFDLETCLPSATGQLVVEAVGDVAAVRDFDWHCTFSLQEGGLREAPKGAAFVAPEKGYLPSWVVGYAQGAKPWRSGYDTFVYYNYKGHYGMLRLEINADDGSNGACNFFFSNVVDVNGGRILADAVKQH